MLGVWSGEVGGFETKDGTVVSTRGLCSWHVHCRENRIGGRYRSDFDTWLDERRASEKPFIDGASARPTAWVRHEAQDLWEAVNGVRELPANPARIPAGEWWGDPEPEDAVRRAPPALVRWVRSMVPDVIDGKVPAADVLDEIRKRMAEHTKATSDEVFEP